MTEIRANGIPLETRCVGRGKYEYRLLRNAQRSLFCAQQAAA